MEILKCHRIIWQILLTIQIAVAIRNYRIDINTLDCRPSNPEYIANATCILKKLNGQEYVNATAMFLKPIKNFNVRWVLDGFVPDGSKIRFVDITVEGCTMLEVVNRNKFLQISLKNLQKYSNALLKCPLKANFWYTVKDYVFDENDLPTYIPNGRFRLTITCYILGETTFKLTSDGEVVNIANNKKRIF